MHTFRGPDGPQLLTLQRSLANDSLAKVNFMEKCTVKKNTYRWPPARQSAEVEAKFVIAEDTDFNLATNTGPISTLSSSCSDWLLHITWLFKNGIREV
jgi:hypothetical protein